MFSQLTEQVKKSSQPASDLFAANVKALQAVSEQQTSLVSGVITDSVKLLKTFSEQTEVKGLLAAQSVYAESVRERLTSTSKNTYGTFNTVSQQFADAMKTSFETAKEAAETAGKSVAAPEVAKKPAPAKKVAAKKAPVKAASPAPAPAKEEAPAEAKAAPSEKPAEAAKPVPTLSADNVRATKPAAKKAPAKKTVAKKAAPKAAAKPAPKAEDKK